MSAGSGDAQGGAQGGAQGSAQGGAQGGAPSRSCGTTEAAPGGSSGDCLASAGHRAARLARQLDTLLMKSGKCTPGEPPSSLALGIAPPFSPPPRMLPISPSGTVLTPPTSAPSPPRPAQAARLVERLDRDAAAPARAAQLDGGSAGEDHGSLEELIAALRQTVAMLDEGEGECE